MRKKLTITIDEQVYAGLYRVVGRRHISQFIENLVRPQVFGQDLEAAYLAMSQDEEREAKALEWTESTFGDVANEAQ
jgi:predicted CopG family antitoxin